MKLKHILLTISAAGILFACTSEENINPPASDLSLNLSLKMQDVRTKAVGDLDNPYKYATPAELEVSKCVVALFRLSDDAVPVPGELMSAQLVTDLARTTISDTNDTLAYRIANIPAKTGKMRVLVIANSALDFSGLTTYDQFKNVVETTNFSPSFNPETLVKVGYVDMELTAENYKDDIIVPMVQLATRVDLNIIVDMEKEITGEEISYPTETSNVFEYFRQKMNDSYSESEPLTMGETEYKAWLCSDAEAYLKDKGITQYINPKTNAAVDIDFTGKIIEVTGGEDGIAIDSLIQTKQWALRLNAITIKNIQTQSNVILEAVNSLPLLPFSWIVNPDKIVSNTYKITFYTYEKGLYADDNNPNVLTVDIDADLVKGTATTTKSYGVKTHGIWVDGTTGIQNNDWEEGDKFVSVYNEVATTGEVVDKFTEDAGTQSLSSTFTVKINPKKTEGTTDGVIHGNLYSADVIFKAGFKEPVLEYNVVGWGTPAAKDIPAFE